MISVITPFYRGNKYLQQLFLVIQKNYMHLKKEFPEANIELIIVNDSPYDIVEIPKIKIDFSFKIIDHEINSGIQQARVTGLKACSGDYVLFLDQDDVLVDDALLSQVRVLIAHNAEMVICNAYMEKKDGTSYLLYRTTTDFLLLNNLTF